MPVELDAPAVFQTSMFVKASLTGVAVATMIKEIPEARVMTLNAPKESGDAFHHLRPNFA